MADVRMAVLGTGGMARTMAAAIDRVSGLKVTGFVSRDPARARSLAATLGGTGYASLNEALTDADALYVATNNVGHAAASVAALKAGKPVLCEKPLALDAGEAQAIADASESAGTLFMEAVATPFLPAVAEALAAARDGRIGRALHLSASFGYPANRTSHPGLFADPGGGVLLDRGVYLVTLARLALGPIEAVRAIVKRTDGTDTTASLSLRHAGGGTSTLACSLDALLENGMTISGSGGSVSIAAPLLSAERLRLRAGGLPDRQVAESGLKTLLKTSIFARRLLAFKPAGLQHLSYGASPYAPELIHFRDLVRKGARESPVLPPSVSAEVMRVLDEARAQA